LENYEICSSGHGKYVRGASGYLDEVDEARRIVDVRSPNSARRRRRVTVFHDDVSDSQSENLDRIVDFHNSKSRPRRERTPKRYEDTNKPMELNASI
jgi:N-acetylmuramoyl-L-alanine amidase